MPTPKIATVVFPARNFSESVAAWSTVFGTGPAFSSNGIEKAPGQADFAVFKTADIEIGLTSLPWVGHRSRFWEPEPLRWAGIRGVSAALALADRHEARSGRPSPVASAVQRLLGD